MRERGFLLVLSLLLVLLLFVMGMAYLGSSAARGRAASSVEQNARAYWLARAGLEDAMAKLTVDMRFPQRGGDDQLVFSWSEDLPDAAGGLAGSYTVEIDQTFSEAPYQVLRITSVGKAGRREAPDAQRVLQVDLDVAPELRGSPGTPNPELFHFLRSQDSGSL